MARSNEAGTAILVSSGNRQHSPATHRKTRKLEPVAVALTILLLAPLVFSQQIESAAAVAREFAFSPAVTLQANVREVDLVLSVSDQKGHFVHGLRSSDLTVFDNGEKQTNFTFFKSQTDLPLRIALVVDMSASVTQRFSAEQGAMKSFLKTVVRRSDSVELFAFNQQIELTAPVQNNWKQLSRRMKKLNTDGDTALLDAICSASRWLAEDQGQSRRIIILVTDGEENTSKATMQETIATALKAEASIYSVNIGYLTFDDEAQRGEQILKQLSDRTGGIYLRAQQDGDVSFAFGKVRRELRNQYALAYKPLDVVTHSFHSLQVIARRNLRVRCRPGYYVK